MSVMWQLGDVLFGWCSVQYRFAIFSISSQRVVISRRDRSTLNQLDGHNRALFWSFLKKLACQFHRMWPRNPSGWNSCIRREHYETLSFRKVEDKDQEQAGRFPARGYLFVGWNETAPWRSLSQAWCRLTPTFSFRRSPQRKRIPPYDSLSF